MEVPEFPEESRHKTNLEEAEGDATVLKTPVNLRLSSILQERSSDLLLMRTPKLYITALFQACTGTLYL